MKSLPVLCTGLTLFFAGLASAQTTGDAKPAPSGDAAGKESKEGDSTGEKNKPDPADTAAADAALAAAAAQIKGVDALSIDQRKQLLAGVQEVSGYLRGVRLLESLQKLSEMETDLGGSNYYIENLRGAAYTKMRKFDKAREHFRNAVKFANGLAVESFHPRFNLAELDFVEKKWDAARDEFQKLLKDPGKPNTGSDPLMNFKILICHLQQEKKAEAEAVMKTFDQYDSESPAYYYAHAVELFIKKDKDGAGEWLESAKRIYPKEINEVFNDSLVEMGWLETLQ